MSDARSKVLDMVNKKAKHYKELKEKIANNKTSPEAAVFEFLSNMEDIYATVNTLEDLHIQINMASRLMDEKMKLFDPHVNLEIMWDKREDSARITGVHVRWSSYFLKNNPGRAPECLIDYSQLLMNSL